MYSLNNKTLQKLNIRKRPDYKGRCSLVFKEDNNMVKMLTRDRYKIEWYNYIKLGKLENVYSNIQDGPFTEFPIYEIYLPELSPLLPSEIQDLKRNILIPLANVERRGRKKTFIAHQMDVFNFVKNNQNIPNYLDFINFIQGKEKEVLIDLNSSNIMVQDEKYVLTDPFFPIELLKVFLPEYYISCTQ